MKSIVNVATTERFQRGQQRLMESMRKWAPGVDLAMYQAIPRSCPDHAVRPYAFKAFALKAAWVGTTQLLWCDASIVAIGTLDPIWDYAERYGAWFSRSKYRNSEWTNVARLSDLGITAEGNEHVDHVVGGAFAIDLRNSKGRSFFDEYYRLASQTTAFCGPWTGPKGVAHRHDQTAASVICHNLGIPLTSPPVYFSYPPGSAETILLADGSYE